MNPTSKLILKRSKSVTEMSASLVLYIEHEVGVADTAVAQSLRAQFTSLKSLKNITHSETGFDGVIDSMSFVDVAEAALANGWDVFIPSGKLRNGLDFEIDITSSGEEWFELNAKFNFGDYVASLGEIIKALQSGEKFAALGDGSTGLLPEDWSRKFATIADAGMLTAGGIRISKLQALFLSSTFDEHESFRGDSKYLSFREMLADFRKLAPAQPSEYFHGSLRHYQQEGLSWLTTLTKHNVGGILADDMGLGKTVQILALLSHQIPTITRESRPQKGLPSLIVAPKSLIFNWAKEAETFTPDLEVLAFTGSKKDETDFRDYDLVLVTYQTLRNHIEKLAQQKFEYFILDEAHYIKNSDAQVSVACRQVRANRKIALTGTPVENSLGDLFSILSVVNPGLIGDRQAEKWAKAIDAESLKVLARALKPFILRRTKEEVLKDLPEKTEQVLYCELSPAERKRYSELKTFYWENLRGKIKEKGFAGSKIDILEGLLRLRQAACHQGLLDVPGKRGSNSKSSSKFNLVIDQLETVLGEGSRALVFSQFTSLLKLFGHELTAKGIRFEYLDGQTKDRAERVGRFQNGGAANVFLLSLKAGGVGLNLTSADYVYVLDPWWNPAAEAQAIDRAHRYGQKKKVFAYKIIAKDSVEEKILEMQNAKKKIANAIVSNDASMLTSLSLTDLSTLFN